MEAVSVAIKTCIGNCKVKKTKLSFSKAEVKRFATKKNRQLLGKNAMI
jgi:hypothetical protein